MNDQELESCLSQNRDSLAVTAPLIQRNSTLVGLHTSLGESLCAEISTGDLNRIGQLLYKPKGFPLIAHGLKRIWESLDLSIEDQDLRLITDTKVMAYLLDPDAGKNNDLTLTHLAHQYLGEEYPHIALKAHEKGLQSAIQDNLMRDARIIWDLGQELPRRMSKDLLGLYRQLEMPVMLVLYQMHKAGIGVDTSAAEEEQLRTSRGLWELQQRLTGGEKINFMSPSEVFHFLAAHVFNLASILSCTSRRESKQTSWRT